MAVLPIKYSDRLPPAVGPSVRGGLDTDTGAGALWSAVAQSGSKLAEVGMGLISKIQDAEDAISQSEGKRAMDEALYKGLMAAKAAPDDETAKRIWDDAKAVAQNVAGTYKRRRVRDALTIGFNNMTPQYDESLAIGRLAIRKQNILDSGEMNYEEAAITGDLTGMITSLNAMIMVDPANATKYRQKIERVEFYSALVRIPRFLDNAYSPDLPEKERAAALVEAQALRKGLKPITPDEAKLVEQLDSKIKQYRKVAEAQEKEANILAFNEIMTELDKNRLASQTVRQEIYDRVRPTYDAIANKLTAYQRSATLSWLNNWLEGKEIKADPLIQAEAEEKVNSISKDSSPEQRELARKYLYDNYQLLGPRFVPLVEKLSKQDKIEPNADIKAQIYRVHMDNSIPHINTFIAAMSMLSDKEKWTKDETPIKLAGNLVLYRDSQARLKEDAAKETAKKIEAAVLAEHASNSIPHINTFIKTAISQNADTPEKLASLLKTYRKGQEKEKVERMGAVSLDKVLSTLRISKWKNVKEKEIAKRTQLSLAHAEEQLGPFWKVKYPEAVWILERRFPGSTGNAGAILRDSPHMTYDEFLEYATSKESPIVIPEQTAAIPKSEYDALPSGAIYIGQDGKRYKKH